MATREAREVRVSEARSQLQALQRATNEGPITAEVTGPFPLFPLPRARGVSFDELVELVKQGSAPGG